MKKQFLLIGALVAMSMGVMFTACKNGQSDKEPANGCKCTIKDDGETFTERFSIEDMEDYYGVTTCSKLASTIKSEAKSSGVSITINCSAY